jgi:glycosyltransferase domain-containing protein
MNYSILNNLTIIIFSYNRHIHLKRVIRYWSNYNVRLVVLDGSTTKLEDPCLKTKNLRYIYDQSGFFNRLLSSPNFIDTEYMILGSDDEFYLPSALSSCIEFLNKEHTYSSCQGVAIGFGTRKKGQEAYGFQQYPKLKDLCLSQGLNQEKAIDRISKHFSYYTIAHTFSVIRSSKWKIICKHVFEKEYNFYCAWELQIEFLALVSGKTKIIPELMWMRNNEEPPVRGTNPSLSSKVLMPEWWHSSYYKEEKNDFLYRMKKACDELSTDQNVEFTKDTIVKLFEYYINGLSMKSFLASCLDLISLQVKNLIKSILPWHEIRTKKYKNLEYETSILESQGYKVNHEEISRIILILLNSRN